MNYICFTEAADGSCLSGAYAVVTSDYTDGVFTPQVWLFNPNTSSVVDPAVPEPGALGVLLFGAGFALTRRRRR